MLAAFGSRTVSCSYDDASRRTSITYPGGTNQVAYAYDAANRLSSVTDWNSNATSYSYDDANRMTTTTLPSGAGVVSTYTYDNANRLTSIVHDKGGTTLASASYTLDNAGNRTQRVDQQGAHSYVYDNLYRLTSVTYPGPSTTSYAFDAFGNRTSKTDAGGTTSYAYDDADRITSITPPSPAPVVNYTWDNNGNLTNRGSDTFSWDYEDRMTSATVNSVTTSFAYRGDGLRDSRTTGGNTTTFTWDTAGGLPVVLDDGSQYVYGAGLTAMKQSGSWYYYLADGLGSTMAILDSSGAVQKGYTYDVYGKPTATGTLANEFDFAGQQTDPTGLQYLRARYMDPETGTFLSREPMAVLPGWSGNPFGYGAGNPARYSDPTGLFPIDGSEAGSCSDWCWLAMDYSDPSAAVAWFEGFVDRHGNIDVVRHCAMGLNEKGSESPECGPTVAVRDIVAAHNARIVVADLQRILFTILGPIIGNNAAARAAAKAAGWEEVKTDWSAKGQSVFKKGNRYIARDLDSHSGGAWKEFDAAGNRVATLDKYFRVIGP